MARPELYSGYTIQPHVHRRFKREIFSTQEVLFIKRGRVRVDFYESDKTFVESRTLQTGDIILLVSGGHGFEMLEDSEMVEVKQGPYSADDDKQRFAAPRIPDEST